MNLGLPNRGRLALVLSALGILCVALSTAGAASAGSGTLAITSVGIGSGQTLTGKITWTAQTDGTVNRVAFSIDGSVGYTDSSAPYTFNGDGNTLDTTTLSNGSHVFAVTAYPTAGKRQPVTSSVTATVSNASQTPQAAAPASTSPPTIAGTAAVGQTLTASSGSWSGTAPITYAYQWQLCNSSGGSCSSVAGASAATFVVPSSAAGYTIRVAVTASNAAGSATASSSPTGVVPATSTAIAPSSTGTPAITGSPVSGQTLTASTGTWSGTTPMSYAYQWLQCNTSGAACSAIGGATSGTFLLTSTQVGSTVRARVTATNSAGSATAQSAQTATVTATASVTSSFDSMTGYLDAPLPALTNAITVSSASAFVTAIANAKAGQTINVLGNVLIPGEFTGFNRIITGGTVNVVFQPGAGFTGMAGSRLPAVWLKNAGGWRIWGGTITNPDGNGILVYAMPGPVVWTGFTVSNTGDTCVAVYPVGGDISNLTLKGVAGTATPNLSFDPHVEKGTGIHAWNIADAGTGLVKNSTFAADVLNQATGSGVEWDEGQTGAGNVLYARARNLGFALPGTTWLGYAQQQTAGNVVQLWGSSPPAGGAVDVKYAEGNAIQGRMLETDGAYAGASYASSSLDYGVASGPIMQSPLVTSPAYHTGTTGLHLGNVSPTP